MQKGSMNKHGIWIGVLNMLIVDYRVDHKVLDGFALFAILFVTCFELLDLCRWINDARR
jgi:hypothetical protein